MSGINPQKKLFEEFRRPHISKNYEIAYTALRTGSELNLKLFMEQGMLEWLIESEYRTDTRTSKDYGITNISEFDCRRGELIILMTNMMEVGDYGN